MTDVQPSIYFACSIRGGRDDVTIYVSLLAHIKSRSTVLTEIFADSMLTTDGMDKPSREIWQTDIAWVRQADAVIAEVTTPSLGVGYEIAKAEEWGKPVLALYRLQWGDKKLSAMIDGAPGVTICRYIDLDEAFTSIDTFVRSI